jgi:nitrogen fixation protein NifU and related proteins
LTLYSPTILEHAKRPRKLGRIISPDVSFEEVNPLCGDRIRIELRFHDDRTVKEVGFSGEMCAIARASASLLLMSIEGMTSAAIAAIHDTEVLQNLDTPMHGIRIQCALLPATALKGAILSRVGCGKKP